MIAPVPATSAQSPAMATATPILSGRGIRKRFGLTEALRGVDVDIAPSEVVAVMSGRPVPPIVDAERDAHLARMRELTAIRRGASLPIALLADYALFHLEADLRWLDLTEARVADLARLLESPSEVA